MGSSSPLNERQLAIIRLPAEGRTNSEIAAELHLSTNTIKWYLQQIYEALRARNRVEALEAARAAGLLGKGSPAASSDSDLPRGVTLSRRGALRPSRNDPQP